MAIQGYSLSPSPCLRCSRVADPRRCDNKNCQVWRRWFVARWESVRQLMRQSMDTVPLQPQGQVIGGIRYSLPHRVREYLSTDPCTQCACPGELCVSKCRVRRAWEEAKGESFL